MNATAETENRKDEQGAQSAEVAALRAEVERLRAALRDVVRFADVIPPGIVDRACAALGEE